MAKEKRDTYEMKIAILDDEKFWREEVSGIISERYSGSLVKIDVYSEPMEFIGSIEKYNIAFVDIEMPEIDGFDVISKRKNIDVECIYNILTTHVEMSRKGYLVNAFRYLDKSNLKEELDEALSSAELVLGRSETVDINIVGEGNQKIPLKSILCIEKEGHSIIIYTNNGDKRSNESMNDLEKKLENKWFFRCHKSFIVNLDEVRKIEKNIIYLNNGNQVDIAYKKMHDFKVNYLKRQYDCANG